MSPEHGLRVAVVGATGLVGSEVVSLLAERRFPIGDLRLYASARSAGEEIEFSDRSIRVARLDGPISEVDVAFLCASTEVSRAVAGGLAESGALVVDLSPAPAVLDQTRLVLNAADARVAVGASRGCVLRLPDPFSRLLALPLMALAEKARVRRVIATLLAPASSRGRANVGRLSEETIDLLNLRETEEETAAQIAFRCVPEVREGAAARVEAETASLAGGGVAVSVSVVDVPTFFGQAASVSVELEAAIPVERVRQILRESPSLLLVEESDAVDTLDVIGADGISIVGLHESTAGPGWLQFWALSDNVRQGAALAAVSIVEGVLLTH